VRDNAHRNREQSDEGGDKHLVTNVGVREWLGSGPLLKSCDLASKLAKLLKGKGLNRYHVSKNHAAICAEVPYFTYSYASSIEPYSFHQENVQILFLYFV
jgi:hypothetical protein